MPKMTELFGQKDEKKIDRKWVTTWIHYSKLKKNPGQYKERTRGGVEELADMIEADGGVLQNLIVRKCDADQYEIVAGHRRTLACQLLVEERNKKEYEFLPCVIRNVSDAKSRFSLVSTNGYGVKTSYETMHEIEEMLYLLENYPEEFPELQEKGRMVEKLAKRLNMSRSVISDYQNISHNLCETGREMFKRGELNKSAAVQLAGMEEKEQKNLIKEGITKATEIKARKKIVDKQSVPNVGTELEVKERRGIECWIPCGERLPEVQEDLEDEYCPEFNVTIRGAKEATTLRYSWDGTWFDANGNLYDVIAWQPLPEPYKDKAEQK